MKKKATFISLIALLFVLLTGTFLVVLIQVRANAMGQADETKEEKPIDITMFSAYTDIEEFQSVPVMETENGKIEDPVDYGSKNYVVNVGGSTVEEYQAYLKTLEQAGFTKHSDNGEDGMEGYAYSAGFTKDKLTVVVSHAIHLDRTYISVGYDVPLSDYMIKGDLQSQNANAKPKTKLHMLELHDNGNSFIIELKNGHFVVHDGGQYLDTPYFLDYIEELTPGDEKPVIEAWFISHAHSDHTGVIHHIARDPALINRIYVEGIYYVEPSAKAFELLTMGSGFETNLVTSRVNLAFKSTDGTPPEMYRPMYGQRYYFSDLTIDVTLTMEQLPESSYYSNDFNDTSTWLMHHIEGQRILIAGDTYHTGIRVAMQMYDEKYFDLDVYAVFHHGINVVDEFTDYCTYKTVLYTAFRTASIWEPSRTTLANVAQNEKLRQSCEEYVSHGDGTVVLTFPYKVGEYKIMEPCDWRYDGGVKKTTIRK